jgi:uncharacterized protein YjdB
MKGGKVGNYKSVTVKSSVVKKARKHVKIRYESTNTNIATVSKKGVVKAKAKGTCYIYAYAQNGVFKKIRIRVK